MTSSPTNPSSPARLIVCEGSGQWSAALRGELAEAGVRLWECRSLPEAWDALAQTPAAFVIVEATEENLESLLRRMTWSSRDFPQARIAVVAQRNMARCEWLLREAGAVHFLTLPRRLAPWPAWWCVTWPTCRRPRKPWSSGFGQAYPGARRDT